MTTNKLTDYKELQAKLEKMIDDVGEEALANIKELFIQYPDMDSFDLYINNHEFNDGDATSFYVSFYRDGYNTKDDVFVKDKEFCDQLSNLIDAIPSSILEHLYNNDKLSKTVSRSDFGL